MVSQEDNLKEIEHLVRSMEGLERQLNEKREQQEFVSHVIAEKQLACQQAKDAHEEKIKALARQARKQRARKAGRGSSLGPTSPSSQDLGPARAESPKAQAYLSQQFDMAQLQDVWKEALGPHVLQGVLGGSQGPVSEGDLDELSRTLSDRLKDLQGLNGRLSEHWRAMQSPEDCPGAGPEADLQLRMEFEVLKNQVAAYIEVDGS
mmetsp:Transcript_52059/g.137537  ORF Transcript_52059/g.137537 Transcript_52059/m.137537 type:complete len:206 (-) Transcript_52059:40-657(-)